MTFAFHYLDEKQTHYWFGSAGSDRNSRKVVGNDAGQSPSPHKVSIFGNALRPYVTNDPIVFMWIPWVSVHRERYIFLRKWAIKSLHLSFLVKRRDQAKPRGIVGRQELWIQPEVRLGAMETWPQTSQLHLKRKKLQQNKPSLLAITLVVSRSSCFNANKQIFQKQDTGSTVLASWHDLTSFLRVICS